MGARAGIWTGVGIGATVGSSIPYLWGASDFSFSAILFGGIGALVGLWLAFKMTQ